MEPKTLGYANANGKPKVKWSRKKKFLTGLALLALAVTGTNRSLMEAINYNKTGKVAYYIPSWDYNYVQPSDMGNGTYMIYGTLPFRNHLWAVGLGYEKNRGFVCESLYCNLNKPIKNP